MNSKTKLITTGAVLCAIAYVAVFLFRIPVFDFLKYEPKDVIIVIGGFLLGPLAAFLISFVVSLIEMVTISDNGFIGFVMNVIASATFACTASVIYQKNRTLKGAVIGLFVAVLAMTGVMLLWNYLITPLYLNVPREVVVGMMLPVLLPFNLLKGGLNMAIALLLYRPIVNALKRANLITHAKMKKGLDKGVLILALFLLFTGIMLILVFQGVL